MSCYDSADADSLCCPVHGVAGNDTLVMGTDRTIRILVVDDHRFLREAISSIVNSQPDMTVIAEAPNGKVAVQLFPIIKPDVTLMDMMMPEMNGVEAIERIMSDHPEARVVVLSGYDFMEEVKSSFEAGARAYVLKEEAREKLVSVIRAVHAGAVLQNF